MTRAQCSTRSILRGLTSLGRRAPLARTWSLPPHPPPLSSHLFPTALLFISTLSLLSASFPFSSLHPLSFPLPAHAHSSRTYTLAQVNAKTFLEKRYNDDIELEDAIHTAILTLKEGFEGQISENNIEIGVVNDQKIFRVLTPAEILDYLGEVE